MPRQNNRRIYAAPSSWYNEELLQPGPAEVARDFDAEDAERYRLEMEFMRDMDAAEREATQREVNRIRAEELGRVRRPVQRNELALNKTQLREIMAHSHVWERVPSNMRLRINNAVASEGRMFRLTNSERNELRGAINHGRSRRPVSERLMAIFAQATRWS